MSTLQCAEVFIDPFCGLHISSLSISPSYSDHTAFMQVYLTKLTKIAEYFSYEIVHQFWEEIFIYYYNLKVEIAAYGVCILWKALTECSQYMLYLTECLIVYVVTSLWCHDESAVYVVTALDCVRCDISLMSRWVSYTYIRSSTLACSWCQT